MLTYRVLTSRVNSDLQSRVRSRVNADVPVEQFADAPPQDHESW